MTKTKIKAEMAFVGPDGERREISSAVVDKILGNGSDDEVKDRQISAGAVKDDFCNYSYEQNTGEALGSHNVKGTGLIRSGLIDAFIMLRIHLAFLDDAFSVEEQNNAGSFEQLSKDVRIDKYVVDAFKIKSSGQPNESIVLAGNKYVDSVSNRIEMVTPKVVIGSNPSYRWGKELKEAADEVRYQIELYRDGNFDMPEKVEKPAKNAKQTKANFDDPEAADADPDKDEKHDEDFEASKVD